MFIDTNSNLVGTANIVPKKVGNVLTCPLVHHGQRLQVVEIVVKKTGRIGAGIHPVPFHWSAEDYTQLDEFENLEIPGFSDVLLQCGKKLPADQYAPMDISDDTILSTFCTNSTVIRHLVEPSGDSDVELGARIAHHNATFLQGSRGLATWKAKNHFVNDSGMDWNFFSHMLVVANSLPETLQFIGLNLRASQSIAKKTGEIMYRLTKSPDTSEPLIEAYFLPKQCQL